MESTNHPVFSFVLPTYNEDMNVAVISGRLVKAGEQLGRSFEIVFVDDGSTDDTGAILDEMARSDARIRVVHFSRNFGHMAALTAGLETAEATGAVICLDADGQHPPELIPEIVAKWDAGADIVQTIRAQTADATLVKRVTSRFFYRFLNQLADLDLPEGAADFRLMDRQAVDAINSLPERIRFVRGLVYWVGFRKELFPYESPARLGGVTKYNLLKMARFALAGITSFSYRPLRVSFFLGTLITMAASVYAAYILICFAAGKALEPGWTSMLLVVLSLGGIQLLALGITSEYLARLYIEIKQRPVYVVRKNRDIAGEDAPK